MAGEEETLEEDDGEHLNVRKPPHPRLDTVQQGHRQYAAAGTEAFDAGTEAFDANPDSGDRHQCLDHGP